MLQREHSSILSTFIQLPVVIKIFVLSIYEWPFYTGFTVFNRQMDKPSKHNKAGQHRPTSETYARGQMVARFKTFLAGNYIIIVRISILNCNVWFKLLNVVLVHRIRCYPGIEVSSYSRYLTRARNYNASLELRKT